MKKFVIAAGCLFCLEVAFVISNDGITERARAAGVQTSNAVPAAEADAGTRDETPALKDKESADRWMLAKRNHAHEIFNGLTDGDYKQIANGGRRMLVTGILEGWLRESEFVKASEYQGQLNAFEFANKELIRHAEDRNIDGALGAYLRLTQSCVQCHKLIRDKKTPHAAG